MKLAQFLGSLALFISYTSNANAPQVSNPQISQQTVPQTKIVQKETAKTNPPKATKKPIAVNQKTTAKNPPKGSRLPRARSASAGFAGSNESWNDFGNRCLRGGCNAQELEHYKNAGNKAQFND